jgi:O-antigen/teichoic acid export membrane protein
VRIAILTGVVGTFGLLLLGWLSGAPSIWLWLIAPLAAVVAVFQVVNAWNVRLGRYSAIARRNFLQAMVLVAFQVTAGLLGAAAGGLLFGLLFAFVVSTASLVAGSGLGVASWRRRSRIPSLYRPSARQLSIAGVLNSAGLQAPLLLMAMLFDLSVVGQFALAQQAIAMPMTLIGQAVSQVFLSRLALHLRENGGSARAHFVAATRPLVLAAIPMSATAFVVAPVLFPIIFGQAWLASGQMVAALSLSLGLQIVAAPLSQTLIVVGAARQQLAWDAGRLLLIVGVFILAARADMSPVTAVWCYSFANAAAYAVAWILALRASDRSGGLSQA